MSDSERLLHAVSLPDGSRIELHVGAATGRVVRRAAGGEALRVVPFESMTPAAVQSAMTRATAPVTLSPEALRAAMEKIRKGATASLNVKQLRAALEALGGTLAETLIEMPAERTFYLGAREIEPEVERARFDERAAPWRGRPLAKLGDLRIDHAAQKPGDRAYYAVRGAVLGTGFAVTLGGMSAVIAPSEYDAHEYLRGVIEAWEDNRRRIPKAREYEIRQWLEEHDWRPRAAAWLGLEPHQPGVPRTRDNTGTCGACFQNMKLDDERRIVLHGYLRPGDGYAHGQCFGVRYRPFELEVDATRDFLARVVTPCRERAAAKVARLATGTVTLGDEKRPIPPGDPRYPGELAAAKRTAEYQFLSAQQDEESFQRLVRFWRVRDLPREGEFDKGWFVRGQKGEE